MKSTLVFLVVLGMLLSPVFAGGDANYDGFRITKTTPAGEPMLTWNCDWDWDRGYQVHVTLRAQNPLGGDRDVEVYAYHPNKKEWFHHHTCTNIDDWGRDCKFYFPIYWGLSENDENARIDLLRAELTDGEVVYSRTFNFHISHKQSSREETILAKIAEFEGIMGTLECPEQGAGFENVVAETRALGKECQLGDSLKTVTAAINELKDAKKTVSCKAPVVPVKEEPVAPVEGAPPEPVAPPVEAPAEPTAPQAGTVSPPPAAPENGACPVGFVLLALGIAGVAWRKG